MAGAPAPPPPPPDNLRPIGFNGRHRRKGDRPNFGDEVADICSRPSSPSLIDCWNAEVQAVSFRHLRLVGFPAVAASSALCDVGNRTRSALAVGFDVHAAASLRRAGTLFGLKERGMSRLGNCRRCMATPYRWLVMNRLFAHGLLCLAAAVGGSRSAAAAQQSTESLAPAWIAAMTERLEHSFRKVNKDNEREFFEYRCGRRRCLDATNIRGRSGTGQRI